MLGPSEEFLPKAGRWTSDEPCRFSGDQSEIPSRLREPQEAAEMIGGIRTAWYGFETLKLIQLGLELSDSLNLC